MKRHVNGAMSNLEVSGNVDGDMNLTVDGDQAGPQAYSFGPPPPVPLPNVPSGLTTRETARIGGELQYESKNDADIAPGAEIIGEIKHELPRVKTTQPPTLGERALSVLGQCAALLIVGLSIVMMAPRWTRRLSDGIKTRPLASLGLGVAGIVGAIVLLLAIMVAIIVFASVAGLVKLTGLVPVIVVLGLSGGAMLIVGFWFFTSYLAEIVMGFLAGSWLVSLANPTAADNRYLSLTAGIVLLALISCVPYLGSIVGWLVVVLGLGALVRWMIWQRPPASNRVGKPLFAEG